MHPKIHIPSILSALPPYSPKLVARLDNGAYEVKVAKIQGAFVWHAHPANDELFYVLSGALTIQIEGGADVALNAGDLFVVPRGVRHCPVGEAMVMLIEMGGTVNTGDLVGDPATREVEDVRGK